MIVKSHEADRFLRHPPKDLTAALFYGPDQGLVRERADTLAKTIVADLADPFRVVEIDEGILASDSARLFDEAAAIAMLGGRRVVRLKRAGNTLVKLFEAFLNRPSGEALVILEAGELPKAAGIRKLFEEAAKAAAVACYPDSARDLAEVVRSAMKTHNLRIGPEALDDLVSRLGADRGITRSELEKLALYAHGRDRIEIEDIRAVLGDQGEALVSALCDAAGEGKLPELDREFAHLLSGGTSAVAVLRSAVGHLQKLLVARSQIEAGETADAVLRRMRPPIQFNRVVSFKAQLSRWTSTKLESALDLLLESEVLCKTTGVPVEVACGRALFAVAAMAR